MYEAKINALPTSLRGTDSARVISVIETVSVIGKGTPDNPSRHKMQYWSLDGKLLAEHDSINDCTAEESKRDFRYVGNRKE